MKNHTSQNPNKQKLGVIGVPISHSKSPLIQGCFIDFYGLDATYKAIEIIDLDKLKQFMMKLKQPDWTGINVTIPYKESVISYLDWVHEDVSIIGACNTILNKNGQLHGYNTDAEGFYMPLKNKAISNALILGNGGYHLRENHFQNSCHSSKYFYAHLTDLIHFVCPWRLNP